MNGNPLISIVMPTFNSMRYIKDTIASLQVQTYEHHELLICDGGSTDGTLEYLETLGDARYKLVSRKDSGLANSINIGFSHGKGDIFCWLNSDDVYLDTRTLERVVNAFRAKPLNFVVGGAATMSEDGVLQHFMLPWIVKWPFKFRGYSNIFTGSLFFKRAAWQAFGGFSEKNRYAFEYELTNYLLNTCKKGTVLGGDPLAAFRLRSDSVSGANVDKLFDERARIFDQPVLDSVQGFEKIKGIYSVFFNGFLVDLLNYKRLKSKGLQWKEYQKRPARKMNENV